MHADLPARRKRICNLGSASQIPTGEGRVFEVGGRSVAVFRTREGRFFATEARCPHRQGPLADGLVGGSLVICPLHGFKFDLASGNPVGNDCAALRTWPVELSPDGELLLGIGAAP
jgi:nitrite reductase (NADH) small subunit